ncbi:MAG: CrcB family protein [Bifidobacteriaceae bacterium]|jgi:CrcB protein|nr:CrcB family protein [Bifidobacteriaceae bacterium]
MNWWLVALGGGLGTGAHYAVNQVIIYPGAPAWPWATLAVNLAGSLMIGLLYGWTGRRLAASSPDLVAPVRALAGAGLLGGFTTYSAFSAEVVALAWGGAVGVACGYALTSAVGGVALAWAGLRLAGQPPQPATEPQ